MAVSTIDPAGLNIGQIGGRRNLIQNGSQVISQRYGTAVQSPAPSGYGIDRWATYKSGAGTFSIQQSTDGPSGFSNSALITVTSNSTPSGGDFYIYQHKVEGYNIAQLDWGTSDAKDVTLSFWVKSSVTGTFSGSFRASTSSYSYVFEYTVSSANTWEYKSVNISGATVDTWNSTNGIGIVLAFSLGQGTTYATSTVGSWVSGNFHGSTTETDLIATSSATWQVTGVQLEVGDVATPFEHRSYGEELSACQRYYYMLASGNTKTIPTGSYYSSTLVATTVSFPVTMRSNPTLDSPTGTDYYGIYANSTLDTFNNFTSIGRQSVNGVSLDASGSGASGTAGHSGPMRTNNASAYVAFDAEL